MSPAVSFPALLQRFFTERLMQQRRASPHTIASYRDTFRLLLRFAQGQLGKAPTQLAFEQVDAPLIAAFLDDLENNRGITARSRNLRLTAIRSFFRYAAFEAPAHAEQIQRVLAIPSQRFTRAQVGFLTRPEIDALLAAPNQHSWSGRRDHALLLVAVQTGLRLSELTGLCRDSVFHGTGAHVRVLGKGRKERAIPLTRQTAAVLNAWLREIPVNADATVFPNARGTRLSADGMQYLLAKHVAVAVQRCPSLGTRRVTPHVLRHTTAMELLQAGADRAVIALWLGHESVETTQIYLDANLAIKEQVLAKVMPLDLTFVRYRPDDQLLAFLNEM
jgi:site-specific recombinase XerD